MKYKYIHIFAYNNHSSVRITLVIHSVYTNAETPEVKGRNMYFNG